MESTKEEKKDNMLVAVIAMNVAAFSATGCGAAFKVIAAEGFHAAELNLMRNSLAFIISCIWCCVTGLNPLKEFPLDKKPSMLIRLVAGQLAFLFTNIAAALIPLSLVMICR